MAKPYQLCLADFRLELLSPSWGGGQTHCKSKWCADGSLEWRWVFRLRPCSLDCIENSIVIHSSKGLALTFIFCHD